MCPVPEPAVRKRSEAEPAGRQDSVRLRLEPEDAFQLFQETVAAVRRTEAVFERVSETDPAGDFQGHLPFDHENSLRVL